MTFLFYFKIVLSNHIFLKIAYINKFNNKLLGKKQLPLEQN